MTSLWQQVIETVEAHRRHAELSEAVMQAAFLFEKANLGAEASPALGASRGWTREVMGEPVDLAARDQLVQSLRQLALERPDDPAAGGLFWALGKVGDPSLLPFFQQALAQQLERNPGAVYQILIALENLGQRPFEGAGERSARNAAENVELARRYLAKVGGSPPG
jgi:hypothetical protein